MADGLPSRIRALEAVAAIRRLQHELGFRLAAGDAAAAAALFAVDGVVEVAGDGGSAGRERITRRLERLVAAGVAGGGLPMVRAHLQIMPVITVSPDGGSARATWRDLDTGGGPLPAYWAEGPIDVEYVRSGDAWRIARLHWWRYLHVPYDGGWQGQATPPQNAPRWPDAFVPPFHFLDEPAPPRAATGDGPAPIAGSAPGLGQRVQALEDERDVENVIGMLGYYLDKERWTQAAGLFASGVATGLPLWGSAGVDGPREGVLRDTIFAQITVSVVGNRAHARWRAFAQWAWHGRGHEWGLATLTAELVRTPDGWRLTRVDAPFAVFTPYGEGWSRAQTPASALFAAEETGGGRAEAGAPAVAVDPTPRGDLDLRVRRLEAAAEIERTQNVYGYYLASFEWDRLAGLFAEDGVIEVALRGVYRGRASVRRSLDLYGSHPAHGALHNHMQWQPVIHVDDSAERATLRARSFSMMGEFGSFARWAGGIYDNVYAATSDGWRILADRMINTYFAPYADGWKDLPARDAPGISSALPPDGPPSAPLVMYPRAQPPSYAYPAPR